MRKQLLILLLVGCLLTACAAPASDDVSSDTMTVLETESVNTGHLPAQIKFTSGEKVYTVNFDWGENSCVITSDIADLEQVLWQYDTSSNTLTLTNQALQEQDPMASVSSRRFSSMVYRFDAQGYLTRIDRDGSFYSEITYENNYSSFAWRCVSGMTSDGPVIDTINGTAQANFVSFKIPTDGVIGELNITYDDHYIDSLSMQFPEQEPTVAQFSYDTDENGNLISISDGMSRMSCEVTFSESALTHSWQKLPIQGFHYLCGAEGISLSLLITMCYVNG